MSTGPFHWVASIVSPRRSSHGRPAPVEPIGADAPATVHPEVTPHRDAAFEAEEEVLPDRLDALEPAPVDRLRDAGDEPPRMRGRRRQAEPDERAEPRCGAVEGVAFGHPGEG